MRGRRVLAAQRDARDGQAVMVRPELLLLSGTLSGLGGSEGVLPQNREVVIRKPHLAIFNIGLFEPWKGLGPKLAAETTLEVRELESQGGLAFTGAKLKRYARELNMDVGAFTQCLDSRKHRQKVEDETRPGLQLGARGTPTFFLNGRILPGAQPFEVFQAAIEEALAKVSTPTPPRR